MSTSTPTADRMSQRQRISIVLCVALTAMLVSPLLEDLGHGRAVWVAGVPFFLIGLSVAMGVAAALQDPEGSRTTTLDVLRRRTFWAGVVLLPLGIYAGAFLS